MMKDTAHQVAMIEEWYQSGIEKYEPISNTLLSYWKKLEFKSVKEYCDFTIIKNRLFFI
jgi:hypothetical protein